MFYMGPEASALQAVAAHASRGLTPRPSETNTMPDTLWYKDAVIYQAHVRAFLDSTNDGVGDFRGLTRKLEYLHGLGINCLWLMPFYPRRFETTGTTSRITRTSIRATARSATSTGSSRKRTVWGSA